MDPESKINHGQGYKKSNPHCSTQVLGLLKPCSSPKVIPLGRYTHLRLFVTLGQFRKSASKYPKPWEKAHKGNPKSSA